MTERESETKLIAVEPTEADVLVVAGRMRGIGLMKPQGYGQIEHDLVRKLLKEWIGTLPRAASEGQAARDAGLEEAADWHDVQATLWDAREDGQQQADWHTKSAEKIRALKSTPPKGSGK